MRVHQTQGKAATNTQRRETTRCRLGKAEPEGREFGGLGRAPNASPRSEESSAQSNKTGSVWSNQGSPGGGGCPL